MFLAQVPPSIELAGWLGCAFALAGGMNQIMKLVDRVKGEPPAGELHLSTTQIAQRVSVLEGNYSRISEQIASTHTTLVTEGDDRGRAIDRKMEELRIETKEDLSRLRGEMVGELRSYNGKNEDRASQIHDRINEILSAVSELRGQLNHSK